MLLNHAFFADVATLSPESLFSFDAGHLMLRLDREAFTIALNDLTEKGPVWYEDAGVFLADAADPTSFTEYRARHRAAKTVARQVRGLELCAEYGIVQSYMPTVLKKHGFAFYFYAQESMEPPHVHVDKGGGTVKFWLNPVRVVWTAGLKPAEVRQAVLVAEEYEQFLLEKWHEFFKRANP